MRNIKHLLTLVAIVAIAGCNSERTAEVLFLKPADASSSQPQEHQSSTVSHEITVQAVVLSASPQTLIDHGVIKFDSTPVTITQDEFMKIRGDIPNELAPELVVYEGQVGNASFIRQYAYIQGYEESGDNRLDPVIGVINYGDIVEVQAIAEPNGIHIQHLRGIQTHLVGAQQVNINYLNGQYPIEIPQIESAETYWPKQGMTISPEDVVIVPFRYSTAQGMQQSVLAISATKERLTTPVNAADVNSFPGPKLGYAPSIDSGK